MREQIERGLKEIDVAVSCPEAVDQMIAFIYKLLEKNKVLNLTSITEPHDVVALHLLDSAIVSKFVPMEAKSLIDIGTGAGFPGIPLKILRPDLEVTLMDALEKRLNWLESTSDELKLRKISVLHGRGEDLSHLTPLREQYDIATARAVAELRVLSEISLPFVRVGGRFLAMKSRDTQEEIEMAESTIQALGGKITEIFDYKLPEKEVDYRIVVIEKASHTPDIYPRRWKKIKNSPIS